MYNTIDIVRDALSDRQKVIVGVSGYIRSPIGLAIQDSKYGEKVSSLLRVACGYILLLGRLRALASIPDRLALPKVSANLNENRGKLGGTIESSPGKHSTAMQKFSSTKDMAGHHEYGSSA